MASKLFTAGRIGSLDLPNRLIRSATQDPFGHRDGTCDEKQVALYKEIAASGVGAIITAYSYISPESRSTGIQVGFATPEQWGRAYDEINSFEHQLVQWGAVLLKFWVDITPEEQLARFKARAADPTKTWKLTDEDWRNRDKYPLYKAAVDDMFRLTSTEFAPWTVLESDSKYYARIQALRAINEALEARLRK